MYYIYLVTNKVNGKIYVGQTGLTIEERFKSHIWSRNKDDHFHAAIRKYGEDAFVIQELGKFESLEEANNAESLWIISLRSYDSKIGYNTKFGGENGGAPTEETRIKIGLASSQRVHAAETREKMRNSHLKRQGKTTSHEGVGVFKGRFRARIKIHGKEISLGQHDTIEEAVEFRKKSLERLSQIGLEAFTGELEIFRKEVNKKRIANRPHRGPLSDEEKEQISIRTKKRWAKNFNWMDAQFVSPFVTDAQTQQNDQVAS
jgi:group I intron endonuclease